MLSCIIASIIGNQRTYFNTVQTHYPYFNTVLTHYPSSFSLIMKKTEERKRGIDASRVHLYTNQSTSVCFITCPANQLEMKLRAANYPYSAVNQCILASKDNWDMKDIQRRDNNEEIPLKLQMG